MSDSVFDYDTYFRLSDAERDRLFPLIKVRIPDPECAESLWARRVDENLVMLDNFPLDKAYRYGDVVLVKNWEVVKLVQRTYPHRFGFLYTPKEDPNDKDADLPNRQNIHARWDKIGEPRIVGSFFWAGLGFILAKGDVTAEEIVAVLTEGDSPIFGIANLDGEEPNEIYGKEGSR